jgi:hypothetical protein
VSDERPQTVTWTAYGPVREAGLRWLVLDEEPTGYYAVVEAPGRVADREWVLYASRPDPGDPEGDLRVIGFASLPELEAWCAASDLP